MGKALIFGEHDEATLRQIETVRASGAEHYVQCADGHLGYNHPIGGVAAYRDKISLSGVGFDIGCGNLATAVNLSGSLLRPKIDEVMDMIVDQISFGVGRTNKRRVSADRFFPGDHQAWKLPHVSRLQEIARSQLGTVGSGNHYVDLFVEEELDRVWIGVHFGSRGLGHKIATHYMKEVGAKDDMTGPPALLDARSTLGREYLSAMDLAGQYASAGRKWVVDQVFFILHDIFRMPSDETSLPYIHNHHNFAWHEFHFGEAYWVVRKGATPAFPGQKGFVGGSMGDDAVIIEGVESDLSRRSLYSTIHGAGRVMSRSDARGKIKVNRETGERRVVKEPRVDRGEMLAWLENKGVTVRGGDLDEAPQAYRRLDDVLKHHEGTIKILHRLTPVGVAMAGPDIKDPYKD